MSDLENVYYIDEVQKELCTSYSKGELASEALLKYFADNGFILELLTAFFNNEYSEDLIYSNVKSALDINKKFFTEEQFIDFCSNIKASDECVNNLISYYKYVNSDVIS